ncbi:uncharacterized protein LOC132696458 isoform X3 [Cylas formicarius]|uniref:uncharacterized protein LOC132696458 isoform X3 n=1 Tax=Cylas formicarius TaxID=197179 RepID=UPI002958D78A|nr:uncharacterized protein LOC132696458 isoform X3 [Cylas formicarius]
MLELYLLELTSSTKCLPDYIEQPYAKADVLCSRLNWVRNSISEKNTTVEIKDFLQTQPVDLLVDGFNVNPNESGPVIEVEDEDAYVTELALPFLESGNFNQVPLIIGTTSGESLMWYGEIPKLMIIKLI